MIESFSDQLQVLDDIRCIVHRLHGSGHFGYQGGLTERYPFVLDGLHVLRESRSKHAEAAETWVKMQNTVRSNHYFLNYFTSKELLRIIVLLMNGAAGGAHAYPSAEEFYEHITHDVSAESSRATAASEPPLQDERSSDVDEIAVSTLQGVVGTDIATAKAFIKFYGSTEAAINGFFESGGILPVFDGGGPASTLSGSVAHTAAGQASRATAAAQAVKVSQIYAVVLELHSIFHLVASSLALKTVLDAMIKWSAAVVGRSDGALQAADDDAIFQTIAGWDARALLDSVGGLLHGIFVANSVDSSSVPAVADAIKSGDGGSIDENQSSLDDVSIDTGQAGNSSSAAFNIGVVKPSLKSRSRLGGRKKHSSTTTSTVIEDGASFTYGSVAPNVDEVAWSCTACTFLNAATSANCEICTNPGPSPVDRLSISHGQVEKEPARLSTKPHLNQSHLSSSRTQELEKSARSSESSKPGLPTPLGAHSAQGAGNDGQHTAAMVRSVALPGPDARNRSDLIGVQVTRQTADGAERPPPIWTTVAPNVIDTVLSVYLRRGRLPEPGEILFCTEETTLEEISNLLRRFLAAKKHGRTDFVFCLAGIQTLAYTMQCAVVELIQRYIAEHGVNDARLVFVLVKLV